MSTSYYPLLPYLKNVRVEKAPEHQVITLFDRQAPTLVGCASASPGEHGAEDARDLIRSFFYESPMFYTYASQFGPITLLHPDCPVPYSEYRGRVLLSEYGEIFAMEEISILIEDQQSLNIT